MSGTLEVNNLVKNFGGLVATNNVSFEVKKGESVGLVGPNGAGKTTIFSQIMGEIRQNSGSIKFDGIELSNFSTPERIRRGVRRTYQVPRPFEDLSVLENIRVGLTPNNIWKMITESPDREMEIELALNVGFSETDLPRKPSELSMGDLRKLEMARTIATNPSLMLLDEVFAGLTAGEISQISNVIQDMRSKRMTFLIVSHDLKSLEPLVDRLIAINYGEKIAEGEFQEVMKDQAVISSYLGVPE